MDEDDYAKKVIEPGDRISKLAHEICVNSYNNSPAVAIEPWGHGFRGGVDWRWRRHILQEMLAGRMFQTTQNDGAGGKPQFFTLMGWASAFCHLGWEIICMCADDIAQQGAMPVMMDNIIDIKKVTEQNFDLAEGMLCGYGRALKEANLVNITGETAIMKHSVTAFCDTDNDHDLVLNWGASCIGLSHVDKRLDGSRVQDKMPVVYFREKGYRCNGGTFFTDLLLAYYGPDITKVITSDLARDFVRMLVEPSKSYAKTIARIHGWLPDGKITKPRANIVGVDHVTGGGIMKKVKGALPPGIGLNLKTMPKPADVLIIAQKMSRRFPKLTLSDWKAHRTLNGSCGMFVIAETEADAKIVIEEARKDGIEAGIAGETTVSDVNEIIIHSRFLEGKLLSSEDPK